MARDTLNVLSLCSGVGGLDLGVELATGGAARVVCHVEREAFAAAILAARMEDETVARAPVWSDLRTFDGRPWRGVVDCVIGGYPCQDFSYAGKRAGFAGSRGSVWFEVARIVAETQPSIVFFENVAGHLTLGFANVRRELEGLGYRVTAGLFTAAEVGAPHKRERLFILGVANGSRGGCGELRPASGRDGRAEQDGGDVDDTTSPRHESTGSGQPEQPQRRGSVLGARCDDVVNAAHVGHERGGDARGGRGGSADAGGFVADAGRERPQGEREVGPAAGAVGRGDGAALGDSNSSDGQRNAREVFGTETGIGCERQHDGHLPFGPEHADAGVDIPIFPPGPGARAEWERILRVRPDLAPATQPRVRGVADGMAGRLDRLRALGNGVVPLVAAYAFVSLFACLREE